MHPSPDTFHRLSAILLCCLFSFVGICPDSRAETSPESAATEENSPRSITPKPIPRARWSEDWSTFGDASPLLFGEDLPYDYFWAPIKSIPLSKNKDSYISFGGEARLAYEFYDEKDMGVSNIGYQDALQLRLALHGDLHLSERCRMFGQLGYGTVDNREGGEKGGDKSDLNAWELFMGYRFPLDHDERVVVRLGRQLIEAANMVINVAEGNNIRQHYDGLRVAWLDDDFIKFDAFAAEYVDFADDSFEMSGTGEYFWGFLNGFRFGENNLNLNYSYLGWDLKDRHFEQGGGGRHDEQRHTLLLWLNQPQGLGQPWGLDYYLAYQFGRYEDQPGKSVISAYAAFGEAKYAFSPESSTPFAGFKTAYFSGDDDPNDDELNTFYDHVFATPFFGYGRDIQPHNLIYLQPNIGYNFGGGSLLSLGYGFHWRADTEDAFYGSPNGITVPAGASDSSWLGQQVQISVRYLINPNLLLTSYLARFFAGDTIKDGGGDDRDYFHLGIHYLF